MKTIEIIGENYFGSFKQVRQACRGLIINYGNILVSYEKKTDQYQIPGGGLEKGETDIECVIREVKEETGYIIDTKECILEIDEYYEDCKYVNKYFIGTIIEKGSLNLTKNEIENGMEPRWISLKELVSIFGNYEKYKDSNEMKSGMYYRELKAIKELIKNQ